MNRFADTCSVLCIGGLINLRSLLTVTIGRFSRVATPDNAVALTRWFEGVLWTFENWINMLRRSQGLVVNLAHRRTLAVEVPLHREFVLGFIDQTSLACSTSSQRPFRQTLHLYIDRLVLLLGDLRAYAFLPNSLSAFLAAEPLRGLMPDAEYHDLR
jgi:hypothetical protein